MTLNELIESVEIKLENKDLTLYTRNREESLLRELEGKRQGMRYCYRHNEQVVEQCEVCEDCLTAEKLACNEGEE